MILFSQSREKNSTFTSDKVREKPVRSVLKSISWRVIGTIDTIIISWFVTGTLSLAFSIGAIELITKMILYFLHERTWNMVSWGK